MDITGVLYLLLGSGGTGAIFAGVTAYRTWKAGKLQDEDHIIKQYADTIKNIRQELLDEKQNSREKDEMIESLRKRVWTTEDQIAWWRRKAMEYNSELRYPDE